MAQIKLEQFKGRIPRTDPRNLPIGNAQVADNCDLLSGKMAPYLEPLLQKTIGASQKSLYLHNSTWMTWDTDVDVVRGPIFNDAFDRIYFTGDGVPKVLGGISSTNTYDLGIPKPVQVPTLTVTNKSTTDWTREWKYYYEESDTTRSQEGTITVTEVTAGKEYSATIPARTTASASAVFVMWFEASNSGGSVIGSLYPEISAYSLNTDFRLDGKLARGIQDNGASTATFTISFDTSTSSSTISRAYVYTFVTAWGEESEPSDPTEVLDIGPNQSATIGNIQAAASGSHNMEKVYIYRTIVGSDGNTTFRFVDEIQIGTGTYLDEVPDLEVGEELLSLDYNAPPSDLAGLVGIAGSMLAGFSGKTVYFAEPAQPHAWPQKYAIPVDYPIVGLGATGNSLVVLTEGYPYVITGSEPSQMRMTRVNKNQSCASKRSIVDVGNSVIYASPDGLVAIEGSSATMMTRRYYKETEWRDLNPSTMIGGMYDRNIYMFSDVDTIIFDLDERGTEVTGTTETAEGLYSDLESDTLYMIQGSEITAWNQGTSNLEMTWRSKQFRLPSPVAFESFRVVGDGDITVKFYSNGVLQDSMTVSDENVYCVPAMRPELYWSFELVSSSPIYDFVVATSGEDIRRVA